MTNDITNNCVSKYGHESQFATANEDGTRNVTGLLLSLTLCRVTRSVPPRGSGYCEEPLNSQTPGSAPNKKRTRCAASVTLFSLKPRNYLRMKVIVPLNVVTDTEERPSPTSPTYFLPSPSALKPLFQNGPIAIFLADD